MKAFEIHPDAVDEVSEALKYYQSNAPSEIAEDLDAKINHALDEIEQYPSRYPFWSSTNFRRYILARFPYVIFYAEYPRRIHVLAVAHTSRRPGYWKKRIAID